MYTLRSRWRYLSTTPESIEKPGKKKSSIASWGAWMPGSERGDGAASMAPKCEDRNKRG